jgi:cytochrome P450
MKPINRMDDPVRPATVADAALADAEVLECPYPTYELLLEEAPVWRDPATGMYVVSRYDDLRAVLKDTDTFSNWRTEHDHDALTGPARKAYERFLEKGWVPAPSLAARDDPNHAQMRATFDKAFRAGRIKDLEPLVSGLAYELMDSFVADGWAPPTSMSGPSSAGPTPGSRARASACPKRRCYGPPTWKSKPSISSSPCSSSCANSRTARCCRIW